MPSTATTPALVAANLDSCVAQCSTCTVRLAINPLLKEEADFLLDGIDQTRLQAIGTVVLRLQDLLNKYSKFMTNGS